MTRRKVKAKRIVLACLSHFKVSNAHILGSFRDWNVCNCRHCIWILLMEEFNLSPVELGKKLGISHRRIRHALNPNRLARLQPNLDVIRKNLTQKDQKST